MNIDVVLNLVEISAYPLIKTLNVRSFIRIKLDQASRRSLFILFDIVSPLFIIQRGKLLNLSNVFDSIRLTNTLSGNKPILFLF